MRPGILAMFDWCREHVAKCPECAWRWWAILEHELGPGGVEDAGLELPAECGEETE